MLVEILIALLVLCVALFAIQRYVPGDATLKNLACLVAVAIFLIWLLGYSGCADHGLFRH
jgi:hypothetical protein